MSRGHPAQSISLELGVIIFLHNYILFLELLIIFFSLHALANLLYTINSIGYLFLKEGSLLESILYLFQFWPVGLYTWSDQPAQFVQDWGIPPWNKLFSLSENETPRPTSQAEMIYLGLRQVTLEPPLSPLLGWVVPWVCLLLHPFPDFSGQHTQERGCLCTYSHSSHRTQFLFVDYTSVKIFLKSVLKINCVLMLTATVQSVIRFPNSLCPTWKNPWQDFPQF
jgi:hypothetical protein